MKNLGATLQRMPHLLLGYSEGQHVVVLVTTLDEARGTQQVHVGGAEILQGAMVGGAAVRGPVSSHVHHAVRPERLPLLVPLEVPGAQRHLALQAGLGGRRRLIDAVVAQNLPVVGQLQGPVVRRSSLAGLEPLDDVAELEVPLQGLHVVELQATFGALRGLAVDLDGGVGRHLDASPAVVVSAGQDHGVGEELQADWAAELVGQQLLRLGQRHDWRCSTWLPPLVFFGRSSRPHLRLLAAATTGNTGRCTPQTRKQYPTSLLAANVSTATFFFGTASCALLPGTRAVMRAVVDGKYTSSHTLDSRGFIST